MRKAVFVVLCMLVTSFGEATVYHNIEDSIVDSSIEVNVEHETVNKTFVTEINETTYVDADKRRFEVGVGADVTLYEDKEGVIEKVTEEYRYDWQNGEHQAFTVVHFNLWQKVKNLFNKE